MPESVLAVLLAFVFSVLLVLASIGRESKLPRLALAWFGLPTFLYLGLISLCNMASTLLATTLPLLTDLPVDPRWRPFLWAFFGVFAFEAVFKNTKLFNQDALDLRKQFEGVRDYAVGAANAKHARLQDEHLERCVQELSKLPRETLDASLLKYQIAEIDTTRDMNFQLVKAYALASARPDHGAAILKAHWKSQENRSFSWRYLALGSLAVALVMVGVIWQTCAPQQPLPPEEASTETELPAPAGANLGDLTVTASFEDQEVSRVIEALARQVGARAVIDQSITCTLSLQLKSNRLAEVMNDLCTICSCDWHIEPGAPPSLLVDLKPAAPSGAGNPP